MNPCEIYVVPCEITCSVYNPDGILEVFRHVRYLTLALKLESTFDG
jgi:hypothetical protein